MKANVGLKLLGAGNKRLALAWTQDVWIRLKNELYKVLIENITVAVVLTPVGTYNVKET